MIRPPKALPYKKTPQNRTGAGSKASRPPWEILSIVEAFVLISDQLGGADEMIRNRSWSSRYNVRDLERDLKRHDPTLLERRQKVRTEVLTWESISKNLWNRVYKMFWDEENGATISNEHIYRRFAAEHSELIARVYAKFGIKVHD